MIRNGKLCHPTTEYEHCEYWMHRAQKLGMNRETQCFRTYMKFWKEKKYDNH